MDENDLIAGLKARSGTNMSYDAWVASYQNLLDCKMNIYKELGPHHGEVADVLLRNKLINKGDE